ncbi:MAG: ion transporter [Oscillospiraceae bacterium]|nr:ion transporter [Oscillospiraceae bacterium]
MKKYMRRLLSALAVYVVLLFLLLSAESADPSATIRSFWDAVWFSLITMTTVGYGDLAPVTLSGRAIGLFFALCSIGLLAALIGVGVTLLSGEFLPRLRLRLGKAKRWYAFQEENEDAAALARALRGEDADCLLIFPAGEKKLVEGPGVERLSWTPTELVRLRGGTDGLWLFFLGRKYWENINGALAACPAGAVCVCMAESPGDRFPANLVQFSPLEAMSRSYWKNHPLKEREKTVLLLGCGAAGGALLERALMTNVFQRGRSTAYHVFDDTADFAALHPEVVRALSGEHPGEDRLIFHTESWAEARSLLQKADRIILAYDDEKRNFEILEKIRTWFENEPRVHVYLSGHVPGVESFGGRDESMRPEFVMKDELNRRARLMNDIYNEDSGSPTPWEELSAFLRQSNIAAADHLIVKARFLLREEDLTELSASDCRRAYARYRELYPTQADLLQEMEHRRWMRFYQMYNWQYDPVRDNDQRRHPLLRPYEELSEADRRKDAYAWEMLGRLGEERNRDHS